jgi:membrane peptidoglycan carboxypeptidase
VSGQRAGSSQTRPRSWQSEPKKPQKGKWSRGWRRWLKWLLILGAAFIALGLLLFAYAYARTDIPDANKGFESQTSYVYYADGKEVLGRFADQNRTIVDLGDVPTHVQDAVVAAEDRTFWTNKGIDPKGIIRAAFNNASGGDTQGASTITQQYVKVYYLSQERSWQRKFKEAILSLKIQRQKSKDEILQDYLNTIYFGRGAYGIEAASRAYFRKPAKALDVREGAVLAAIINSPNGYDPANGRAAVRGLKQRYHYVIDGMSAMGTLPPNLDGTRKVYRLPDIPAPQAESQYGGQRGHVLTLVRHELRKLGFSDAEIDGGGLRVTTTFSKEEMDAAAAGVKEQRPPLKGLHVAVASVDPRNGALRGMYGGQDYLESQLNWATAGGAPGSAFKPFSLAMGLGYGYSLKSTFEGNSPLVIGDADFENEGSGDGTDYGRVSLLKATEESINTAYVDMVHSVPDGPQRLIDTAVKMGIPQDAPGLEPTLSTVLGSATLAPVDMANAYGTIANGGKAHPLFVVSSVKTSDGEVQYEHEDKPEQAIPEDVAADTSYALQQVAKTGTGTNANVIGRPIAGKTGTATDDKGHVRSSWFVGYTPQLSTAVMYVRGTGNEPLDGYLDTFFGGEHPARTWAAVMKRALLGDPVIPFPPAANLEQRVAGHEPLPTSTPSQTASPTNKPSPTKQPTKQPTQQPTQQPSPTQPPPSSQPPSSQPPPTTEVPSPSTEPPSPTATSGGQGTGQGNGNGNGHGNGGTSGDGGG